MCLVLEVSAQDSKWELGALLGSSSILGEMGGDEKAGRPFIGDLQLKRTGLSVGGYVRYKVNPLEALIVIELPSIL